MFIAALFITAKMWKQHKREELNTLWYTDNAIVLSNKRDKVLMHSTTMLNERHQTQKHTFCVAVSL